MDFKIFFFCFVNNVIGTLMEIASTLRITSKDSQMPPSIFASLVFVSLVALAETVRALS